MLRVAIRAPRVERLVDACIRHAWVVVAAASLACLGMIFVVAHHFSMTTDTYPLLSRKLPWRVRQDAFEAVFPQKASDIVVVVDGKTPELADQAAAALAASLEPQRGVFHAVERPDAGPFWSHNGLLFASTGDVQGALAQLLRAEPLLGSLAADPSLRGLADTLSLTLQGVSAQQPTPPELKGPIGRLADALTELQAGRPALFSWRSLINGQPDRRELRHIVLVDPVLDYSALQPGRAPIAAIRRAAQRLELDPAHGVSVRLTGDVPLQDEEFGTLAERAKLIAACAGTAVMLMLWLAVRSARLIAAILATTVLGLLTATVLGLALFHRFNVISVAFIPLFVGMGIDLGIQFSVRYRAERRPGIAAAPALLGTARTMGPSLALAAVAIGVGFLAFAPTAYHGVSQLGVIAGLGLLVALLLNLTLLPALIALLQPPGAPPRAPRAWLSRLDEVVLGRRRAVLALGAAAALAGALLVPRVHFDFNPLHLRSARAESLATLLDLMRDPDLTPFTLEAIRPDLAGADRLAARLRADPTVYTARTLSSFIPSDQPAKLALIADAENILDLTLNPVTTAAPPTEAELIASLHRAAGKLREAAAKDPTLAADAGRLAVALDALADGAPAARAAAQRLLIPGFLALLEQVRALLHPQLVTPTTLPPTLVREWLTPDGRARVSALPKGDGTDDALLRRFVAAGLAIAPDAVGPALYLQAYAHAVVDAFIEAGVLSLIAISSLLLLALRRVRDVALTLAPVVLTGLLTLGSCVIIGQPLNFANIIALPLLLGMGVAFHIYFVMAWRSGRGHLLTSSLARGVFFSALATATGFGSLWASSHPGTASMGKLLMISLVWTLVAALIFQPALMGPAPKRAHEARP